MTLMIDEFPKFLESALSRNKRSQLVLVVDGLNIHLITLSHNLFLIQRKQFRRQRECIRFIVVAPRVP